jgi:hypothetical protein
MKWNMNETFQMNVLQKCDLKIDFNNHHHSHNKNIAFALIRWSDFLTLSTFFIFDIDKSINYDLNIYK